MIINKNKIIIGTWPLSGDYGHIEIQKVSKILEHSYSKGFFEYDTAPSYGNGKIEFILGDVFYKIKKIKINTKIGNHPFLGKNFEIDTLKKSFDQSLKRLKIDKINTLYIHNPRNDINKKELLFKFIDELKSQGLIKNCGLSIAKNYVYEKSFLNFFDSLQDDLNLLSMNFLNYDKKTNQQFHARSPFASGILGKQMINQIYKKDDQRSSWLNDRKRQKIINKSLHEISKIIKKKSLKNTAFQFVLSQSKIDKVIFGVKNINHLKFLAKNLNKKKINRELNNKIIEIHKKKFNIDELDYKYLY